MFFDLSIAAQCGIVALGFTGLACTILALWPDRPEHIIAKRHHGIRRANW